MYTVGDVLPFATKVTLPDGVTLANSGAMTLTVTLPDGTAAVGSPFTISPTSTGLYDKDLTSTQAGRYVGYWLATGANAGAHAQVFDVAAATDEALVSLADVKAELNITATTWDTELELKMAAATAKIEVATGPIVRRVVTNERHPGGWTAVWLDQAPGPLGNPFITLTSVLPVAGGTGVTTSLLDVDPSGRVAYLDGYSYFPAGPYYWSYVAGRTQVPAGLQEAALRYIADSWEPQRGASGLPLQGGGSEVTEVPGMGLVNWRLEQDLKPYLRRRLGVA